jgi:transglutaminase-like putative cysteine protease
VQQRVAGYERSDLFMGQAYRVETSALGHGATTWIDAHGQPLLEMALNGVMISALEGKSEAKRYLAQAALNKRETLVEFSLIKPERTLTQPRASRELRLDVSGAPWPPPSDGRQQCDATAGGYACAIRAGVAAGPAGVEDTKYLQPSVQAPSEAAEIKNTAARIVGDATDPAQQVDLLLKWIAANIRRVPVDAFSALDVLEHREAECQGHAYLFAAFARSLGIPTRVVNGLVYSEQLNGFLYHTWVESRVGNGWQAIDPTFAQREADATHLKLVEGESGGDVLPLVQWVGKVRIHIHAP